MTRPSRLDSPPPGPRCPGCWLARSVPETRLPGGGFLDVSVCPRCFCLVAGFGEGMHRVDWTGIPFVVAPFLRMVHAGLVEARAREWRSLPRPPRPSPFG